MNEKVYVANLSGGKDSVAMVLMLIEKGYPLDMVINVDTGMEFPEVRDATETVARVCDENGIAYVSLKACKTFEYYFGEKVINSKNGTLKKGFGWPNRKARWCTSLLKTKVIDSYLREYRNECDVYQYIGFAADEIERSQKKTFQSGYFVFPLIAWNVTESECLQYCYDRGISFGGLYELMRVDERTPHLSCWCCPFQSERTLARLKRYRPALYDRMIALDAVTPYKFRHIGVAEYARIGEESEEKDDV